MREGRQRRSRHHHRYSERRKQLVGFGVFDVKKRGTRMGRNPKTKEEIEIPASCVPQFKAGKALKEAVDKK